MKIFWIISQIYLRNWSSKFSLWWSDWFITRMCENTFQKLPCCRLLSRDGDSSWKMHLSWLNHLNMAMTYSEMHSWNSCFGEVPRWNPSHSWTRMSLYRSLVLLSALVCWARRDEWPGQCVGMCGRFMDADSNSIYQLGSTACYLLLPIKAKIKEKKRKDKQWFHFLQLPPRMGLIIAQGRLPPN